MTWSVSIAEAAEIDIREAFLWYEDQKNNLGSQFEDHVLKLLKVFKIIRLKLRSDMAIPGFSS